MIDPALLHLHVHLPVRAHLERPHVQVAADELEGEPAPGDQEPGLPRAGDRGPDALEGIQVRFGGRRGGLGEGRHGTSPVLNPGEGGSSGAERSKRPGWKLVAIITLVTFVARTIGGKWTLASRAGAAKFSGVVRRLHQPEA